MFKSSILLSTFLVTIFNASPLVLADGSEIEKTIQYGHHNLAINLNKELYRSAGTEENVLVSPVDVYAAMALVLYPSGGQTRQQLMDVMGLPNSYDFNELNQKIAYFIQNIQNNQKTNLTIAEGFFVQNGFEINEAYRQYVKETYNGEMQNVDFAGNGQEAANTINKWISDRTGGRVREICETPYTGNTVAVLANAMYFQGNFEYRFKKSQTQMDKFHCGGHDVDVKYMQETNNVQYFEYNDRHYKALGLPFEDKEFTLYYILPNEDTQVQDVLNQLNSDDIYKIVNGEYKNVHYKIPKMEMEYKHDLEKHLQTLGVHDLFTNKANLEDLAPGIKVSKVNDKVEFKINEDGASGSAATTVDFRYLNKQSDFESQSLTFEVNRPFIYFVHHRNTNFLSFFGVVNKPSEVGAVPVNRRNGLFGKMKYGFFNRH